MPRRLAIAASWRWALLWVAVVVVTCTLTWATIMRVANDVAVIGGPGLVAAPSRVAGSAVTEGPPTPTPVPTESAPSALASASTPAPAPAPAPAPPASPGVALRPAPAPSGLAVPVVPVPAPDPAVQRTLRTDGGVIVAACTGQVVSLRSVTPADGWSVGQKPDGDKIKVSFERGDQSREVEVTCLAGTPNFDLE